MNQFVEPYATNRAWGAEEKPRTSATEICFESASDVRLIGSYLNNNLLYLDWPPDELYLPPMRKIDSILSEQKRRLLRRVSMSSQHQVIRPACPTSSNHRFFLCPSFKLELLIFYLLMRVYVE